MSPLSREHTLVGGYTQWQGRWGQQLLFSEWPLRRETGTDTQEERDGSLAEQTGGEGGTRLGRQLGCGAVENLLST